MSEWTNPFVSACLRAFARLTADFGFEEPNVETLGREVYVQFHKGDRTVSLSCEPGCEPIVELFYPASDTGEPPVPWASRNGVARCRRFPLLGIKSLVARQVPFDYSAYLESAAQALFEREAEWLAAQRDEMRRPAS